MTRVLGIDPGTHRLGWGIIEGNPSKQRLVACGCIESAPKTPSETYLLTIADGLAEIIAKYQPEAIGLETLLFQKNVKTAIAVAEARGVILLTGARHSLNVVNLAPNSIKLSVAGSGSAEKKEVEHMVGLLLGVDTAKLLDDTTDALAVAIAALVSVKRI